MRPNNPYVSDPFQSSKVSDHFQSSKVSDPFQSSKNLEDSRQSSKNLEDSRELPRAPFYNEIPPTPLTNQYTPYQTK